MKIRRFLAALALGSVAVLGAGCENDEAADDDTVVVEDEDGGTGTGTGTGTGDGTDAEGSGAGTGGESTDDTSMTDDTTETTE